MSLSIDLNPFIFKGDRSFSIKETPTDIDALYQTKKEYKSILKDKQKEIYDLQNVMYAHNRYAMLLIFQAMDAAGKDGTIKHIMSGVNPHGLQIFSFKKPSTNELDHDFMWRTSRCMPERGRIGIFNRSYYEEVLVVKVHPEILTRFQRIPREFTRDLDTVWQQRYTDIVNFERYIHHQGIQVMKFFLHLSKQEQKKRFLARIDRPSKNWKFSEADVKERGFWNKYQDAYQDAINTTATPHAPWHVVPADDKKNMRLIVSQLIVDRMKSMEMHYPEVSEARRHELLEIRKQLMKS